MELVSTSALLIPFIWLNILAFTIVALVDILRHDFKDYNKVVWVLVVLLVPVIGPILYFIIGVKQRVKSIE